MDAGAEDEGPEDDAAEEVGPEATDAGTVEGVEAEPDEGGGGEGQEVEALGVEHGDDEDGAEVVDDGERGEEDLERRRGRGGRGR